MDTKQIKNILEAGLLVAGRAMSVAQLEALFADDPDKPDRKALRAALEELQKEYEGRGIELVEIASGFRLQSHASVSDWVANLFQEKTPRYSRALLETLVLIAYRQPITRSEIEEVRGVAVSSNIIKTLQERQWVKVLGHKEVPGRPALLGTSKEFLDYFNLKKLDDLPSLAEIKDLDQFDAILEEEIGVVEGHGEAANDGESGQTDAGSSEPSVSEAGDAVQSGAAQIDDEHHRDASEEAQPGNHGANQGLERDAMPSGSGPEAAGSNNTQGDSASNSGGARTDASSASSDQSASDEQHDSRADDQDETSNSGDDAQGQNETLSVAELDLMQVISNFADEHREEVDARNAVENKHLSGHSSDDDTTGSGGLTVKASNDEEVETELLAESSQELEDNVSENLPSADFSQSVSNDDLPEPGDTLH